MVQLSLVLMGVFLLLEGGDGVVYLWDTTTWQLEDTLTGHTKTIDFLAFSSDGSMLASASRDRTARVWNIHTGEHIRTFTEHSHEVFRVAFSPDGGTVGFFKLEMEIISVVGFEYWTTGRNSFWLVDGI